ncbi:MAG TPA: SMP-30/gluconolactonase/LRE family protein [Jatrophihabitantaceae bacterium]
MRRYVSSPATADRYDHAEGPCWDARIERLLWVDQYVGAVLAGRYDPATHQLRAEQRFEVGHPVGAVVPALDGGWMTAAALGFARLSRDGAVELLAQPEADNPRRMRMNDGKCDDAGRFWAGSIAFDQTKGAASLYRLDPDLTVTTMLRDVTISNGMAWTGDTMFYIDTPTHRVDRFRITPEGELRDRRPFVHIVDGQPDGMCIDVDDCIWVAHWGAGQVSRHSPAGELLAIVDVDAPQVSSCCLGGPDGTTLFITTSQEGMDAAARERNAQSGKLFCVDVDTPGRPAAAFG